MTKAQIKAIYPEVTAACRAYEALGFILSPHLGKDKYYIQKIMAAEPGACKVYKLTLYNWEAAKDVTRNTGNLNQLISEDMDKCYSMFTPEVTAP